MSLNNSSVPRFHRPAFSSGPGNQNPQYARGQHVFRAESKSNSSGEPTLCKPTAKRTKASVKESKLQDVDQEIQEGNAARDKNQYEKALKHYRQAETLSPKDERAYYGRVIFTRTFSVRRRALLTISSPSS